jgi:F-type H+-transporting ATPase subunit a
MIAHPPSIYELFQGTVPILLQSLALALLFVLGLALLVRRELARAGDGLVPPTRLTPRNFVEILLEGIAGQMREALGPSWAKYLPLVGTLGLFILIANLMGLVPGLGGPTSYLETNLAWAMIAFGIAEYVSIREQGLGNYIRHLAGPIWWLVPVMLPVEIVSHLARLVSLTLRLTGNMFADHTLVAVFLSFGVINLFVPWIFMGLGLFVAFLQAFIFTFLTIIYIGQALEAAHHH